MRRGLLVLLSVVLSSSWPCPGHAVSEGARDAASCESAARAAEQKHDLPPGILFAIGVVESGRADAAGHVAPWPWTVDAAGAGAYLPSSAAAVASVQALQRQGLRNIDVGCFQVSLQHHPDAFATLDAAFDPTMNAEYAASFLSALRKRTGSWNAAVAAYHSAQPGLGIPYREQVLAHWGAGAEPLAAAPDPRFGMSVVVAGVRIWTPGAPGTAPSFIRLNGTASISIGKVSLTP